MMVGGGQTYIVLILVLMDNQNTFNNRFERNFNNNVLILVLMDNQNTSIRPE